MDGRTFDGSDFWGSSGCLRLHEVYPSGKYPERQRNTITPRLQMSQVNVYLGRQKCSVQIVGGPWKLDLRPATSKQPCLFRPLQRIECFQKAFAGTLPRLRNSLRDSLRNSLRNCFAIVFFIHQKVRNCFSIVFCYTPKSAQLLFNSFLL